MKMKPIDFQGIVSLDEPLVDHLRKYLLEKESRLSYCITNAILLKEPLLPALPVGRNSEVRLSDAIERFSKIVRKAGSSPTPLVLKKDWEVVARLLNDALWEYIEVLEGFVTELFQQLTQIGFEHWRPEMRSVVDSIRDMLNSRLEEFEWKARRLESLLWEFRWICQGVNEKFWFFKRIVYFWKSLLDRSLISYAKKSRKFLNIKYRSFVKRYDAYLKLKERSDQAVRKFKGYQVFQSLENSKQESFRQTYRLLKMWELNSKTRGLPNGDLIRSLRSTLSLGKAITIFREYLQALNEALFERSGKIKNDSNEIYIDPGSRRVLGELIRGCRAELMTLGATVGKHREFILRTHPDPYVRTRWGFAEWIVGPEPAQTKVLLEIVYEVESLDKLYEEFAASVEKGPSVVDSYNFMKVDKEIQAALHEMGQPLTAKNVLRNRSERLLDQLQQLNELGTFNSDVVKYVGTVMSKGIRADWQYNVLFENPLFYRLYKIHQGVVGRIEDRKHLDRTNKFTDLIKQIEIWVKNGDSHRHVHEIETDMMDMKNYLQSFYAEVQRTAREETEDKARHAELISRQLLEYRFLFGEFFSCLHQHEPEGKAIRNQFLFVDQYFESIETVLNNEF